MDQKTFVELWRDDRLEEVEDDIDDSYRHGNYHYSVFKYEDEYWAVNYTVSGDGEQHGIRDKEFDGPHRVYPIKEVTTTINWVSTKPPAASSSRYKIKVPEVEAMRFPGMPTIGGSESFDDQMVANEAFEAWLKKQCPKETFKYRGANLVHHVNVGFEHIIPPGFWIVKEVGKACYHVNPEQFAQLYEKV